MDTWPTEWAAIYAAAAVLVLLVNAVCLAISIGRKRKLRACEKDERENL